MRKNRYALLLCMLLANLVMLLITIQQITAQSDNAKEQIDDVLKVVQYFSELKTKGKLPLLNEKDAGEN